MIQKKSVIILVTIAVILASVAIGIEVVESDSIPTNSDSKNTNPVSGGSDVGVTIEASAVDDKGANLG